METAVMGLLCCSASFLLGWFAHLRLRGDYNVGYRDAWRKGMLDRIRADMNAKIKSREE